MGVPTFFTLRIVMPILYMHTLFNANHQYTRCMLESLYSCEKVHDTGSQHSKQALSNLKEGTPSNVHGRQVLRIPRHSNKRLHITLYTQWHALPLQVPIHLGPSDI
jgi:hypothetical protein